MSLCHCRRPPHGQSKGRGIICMPWAMSLWRGLVQLLRLAAKERDNDNNDEAMSMKQQSDVNNDSNKGNGGDSNGNSNGSGNGNGNGNGDGNDAAATANGNDIDDDECGIQGRRLDDGNRMTTMRQDRVCRQ